MSLQQWESDFGQVRKRLTQVQEELRRWEALDTQNVTQRSERTRQATIVRQKISELRLEFEKLQRRFSQFAENIPNDAAVQRSRGELSAALAELQDMHTRSRQSAKGGGLNPALAGSVASDSSSLLPTPGGSFVRMSDEAPAAKQPAVSTLSNAELLKRQQDTMTEFDEPIAAIEGSVGNLKALGNAIRREIVDQNGLLADTNQSMDRTNARVERTTGMLDRISNSSNTCRLWIAIAILGFVLIAILILELGG